MIKFIGTGIIISAMTLLGYLAWVPAQAQGNAESAPEQAQANRAQGNSAQESRSQTQASPPPSRRPAPTFTPSERIRADTSVTFPADI